MAKKFYQEEKFLKLQEKWYAKLKKEGHEDIEAIDPSTGDPYAYLHSTRGCYNAAVDVIRKYTPAQERYYELARAHYWLMKGTDEEKEVFRLFCQRGMSVTAVAKVMGLGYNRVRSIITEQEAIFMPQK